MHRAGDIAPELGAYRGKGEALWKSLLVTHGDVLVFVDADLTSWGPHFVTGLLGPLLADDQVRLVKGFYTRVWTHSDGSTSEGRSASADNQASTADRRDGSDRSLKAKPTSANSTPCPSNSSRSVRSRCSSAGPKSR